MMRVILNSLHWAKRKEITNNWFFIQYIQVHIQNSTNSTIYETLPLGSPVLRDMAIDEDNQYITVLTKQTVCKGVSILNPANGEGW